MDFSKDLFVEKTKITLTETVGENLYGKRIIAGLSGGADSVALTLALNALSGKMGFSLVACHINHMIRGVEADRDEDFSRNLCKRYNIEFVSFKKNVPEISRNEKKGLEEAARDVRYNIFESLCNDGDFIATAHTASDNAETVLFNLIRGCGISGLGGIPKRRGNIIRPIIFAERSEVEAFLSGIGESYVTDSTNLSLDCTRNILRHRIIPELTKLNPAFIKSASTLSILAKRDNDFIESIAEDLFTDDINSLAKLDKAVVSRIIGNMYRKESGNMLPFLHTEMLISEIKKACEHKNGEAKSFDLPFGVLAKFECGKLIISKKSEDTTFFTQYDVIAKPGINEICNGEYIIIVEDMKKAKDMDAYGSVFEYKKNIYSLFMHVSLFEDIIGSIRLRSGKSGDRIRISGMSKDIRKMYSAKKIPLKDRNTLPRICDSVSGGIIALPYVGVCDEQLQHQDLANISVRLYKLSSRSDFKDNGQ